MLISNGRVYAENESKSKNIVKPLSFPLSSVKSIAVSLPKGNISLSSSKTQDDISVSIVQTAKENLDQKKCVKNVGLENSQLVVKIASENILFEKANCQYDVTIVVPSKAVLDLDISSGSAVVNIKDVSGVLNFKSASGNLNVVGDTLKNISAKTATGAMIFSYKKCSGRADLDFISATGNMVLNLSDSCKIRVSYKSATGKLFNALGEKEDYQVLINATTATGDLKIGKN
jgi:hypothetical protein